MRWQEAGSSLRQRVRAWGWGWVSGLQLQCHPKPPGGGRQRPEPRHCGCVAQWLIAHQNGPISRALRGRGAPRFTFQAGGCEEGYQEGERNTVVGTLPEPARGVREVSCPAHANHTLVPGARESSTPWPTSHRAGGRGCLAGFSVGAWTQMGCVCTHGQAEGSPPIQEDQARSREPIQLMLLGVGGVGCRVRVAASPESGPRGVWDPGSLGTVNQLC